MADIRPIRLVLLALLVLPGCTGAPPAHTPEGASYDDTIAALERDLVPGLVIENEEREAAGIEERMRQLGVPGVSIAFIDDGRVAWTRVYGLADAGSARPVTSTTRFQAASISKPVAATVALDLVEEGALDLDGDVNLRLTSWRVPANELTAESPVTLRGLLTHTAGLTVHGFPGYGPDDEVPTAVEVLRGSGNTAPVIVDLAPRSEERYSGGGYTVMQQLVEDVSGRPFARLLQERVLAPLEMEHSTYEQPLPADLRNEAATGYRRDGSPVPGRFHTYPERAAAGLWTTPTDLARWAIAIQAALAGGEHPVLERETVRRMVTPDDVGGMGLGPALPEGATFFAHGGANEGFRCLLTAQLDGDEGIVVMTNSDLGSVVAGEVVRTVARERGWNGYRPTVKRTVDLSETERRRLVGVYVVPETPRYTIDIVEEDGELIGVQRWDDQRMRLAAESPSRLFDRRDGTEVLFDLDDDGGPAARFEVQGYRFERTEDGD